MESIYQTDSQFPKAFGEACYFMSILWQLNKQFGLPEWTHEAILEVYNSEEIDHDVEADLTVNQPQKLCDAIVGPDKVLFRGKFDANYETAADEFEILVWHRDGTDFDHFVGGNGYGVVVYDPWSASGSLTVKEGQMISKRIYKIL
jgi:hypothetical protein